MTNTTPSIDPLAAIKDAEAAALAAVKEKFNEQRKAVALWAAGTKQRIEGEALITQSEKTQAEALTAMLDLALTPAQISDLTGIDTKHVRRRAGTLTASSKHTKPARKGPNP